VAGHIHFGPDGYLYVSIGEFGRDPENSQDLSTVKGKILRVNKRDGSPAPDNPFLDTPGADPRIFAYGLRNSFGFTFHPRTGKLYATDNGPVRCDELNLVVPGLDYGWPTPYLSQSCATPQGVQPIYSFARSGKEPWEEESTVAPTGVEFVSGEAYPTLGDSLLACEWSTKILRTLSLGGPGNARVLSDRVVIRDCQLDITQDPSGVIYYSNQDEIRRLIPR
jgi:glucose/arabinose dehydrogenase